MSKEKNFQSVSLDEADSDSDLPTYSQVFSATQDARLTAIRLVKCVLLLFLLGQLVIVISGIMFGRQLFRHQLEISLAEGTTLHGHHHKVTHQEREFLTSAESIAETIFTAISVSGLLGIIIGIVGTLLNGYGMILSYAVGGSVILIYWIAAIRLTPLSSLNVLAGVVSVGMAYWLACQVKRQKKERDLRRQEVVPIYALAGV